MNDYHTKNKGFNIAAIPSQVYVINLINSE